MFLFSCVSICSSPWVRERFWLLRSNSSLLFQSVSASLMGQWAAMTRLDAASVCLVSLDSSVTAVWIDGCWCQDRVVKVTALNSFTVWSSDWCSDETGNSLHYLYGGETGNTVRCLHGGETANGLYYLYGGETNWKQLVLFMWCWNWKRLVLFMWCWNWKQVVLFMWCWNWEWLVPSIGCWVRWGGGGMWRFDLCNEDAFYDTSTANVVPWSVLLIASLLISVFRTFVFFLPLSSSKLLCIFQNY